MWIIYMEIYRRELGNLIDDVSYTVERTYGGRKVKVEGLIFVPGGGAAAAAGAQYIFQDAAPHRRVVRRTKERPRIHGSVAGALPSAVVCRPGLPLRNRRFTHSLSPLSFQGLTIIIERGVLKSGWLFIHMTVQSCVDTSQQRLWTQVVASTEKSGSGRVRIFAIPNFDHCTVNHYFFLRANCTIVIIISKILIINIEKLYLP